MQVLLQIVCVLVLLFAGGCVFTFGVTGASIQLAAVMLGVVLLNGAVLFALSREGWMAGTILMICAAVDLGLVIWTFISGPGPNDLFWGMIASTSIFIVAKGGLTLFFGYRKLSNQKPLS